MNPRLGRRPCDSAGGRGNADRPPGIRAVRQWREAGRDRGRRPTARPTGRAIEQPRVAGRGRDQVLGVAGQRELGRVGRPEEHEPGSAQPSHDVVVEVGLLVRERC